MPIAITDPADPRLADYVALTDVALRRRTEPERGLYIAESQKVIRRALAAGHRPRSYLMAERWLNDLADLVERGGGGRHPGLRRGPRRHRGAAPASTCTGARSPSMQRPQLPSRRVVLAGARRVSSLEDVVDHTNVGAIFRSAAALGVDAVLVTPRCADPLYRRSIRVSMGTVFQVPWTRIDPWPGGWSGCERRASPSPRWRSTDDSVSLDALEPPSRPSGSRSSLGTEGDGLSPPDGRRGRPHGAHPDGGRRRLAQRRRGRGRRDVALRRSRLIGPVPRVSVRTSRSRSRSSSTAGSSHRPAVDRAGLHHRRARRDDPPEPLARLVEGRHRPRPVSPRHTARTAFEHRPHAVEVARRVRGHATRPRRAPRRASRKPAVLRVEHDADVDELLAVDARDERSTTYWYGWLMPQLPIQASGAWSRRVRSSTYAARAASASGRLAGRLDPLVGHVRDDLLDERRR